jgi:hypothetical protein
MATITNKSLRVNLQLTHELGGYIRRMRSCAPPENLKNASDTKTHQLSLSATPQTPAQARGLLTRVRIRGPFDDKIIPLKDNKTIIYKVKTSVSWQAA